MGTWLRRFLRLFVWGGILMLLALAWLLHSVLSIAPRLHAELRSQDTWTPLAHLTPAAREFVRDYLNTEFPARALLSSERHHMFYGLRETFLLRYTMGPEQIEELVLNACLIPDNFRGQLTIHELIRRTHGGSYGKRRTLRHLYRRDILSKKELQEAMVTLHQSSVHPGAGHLYLKSFDHAYHSQALPSPFLPRRSAERPTGEGHPLAAPSRFPGWGDSWKY